VRRVVEEILWEGMRSEREGVMVSGVTTTPVGVVGHQGVTRERERRDVTCGHRHRRSHTAPTLQRGADYVGTTLPHTRANQNIGGETWAFLSYLVDVGGHPCVNVCLVVYMRRNKLGI
jgi:hypothetical protein